MFIVLRLWLLVRRRKSKGTKAVKLSPIKNCENGYALLHRFENASVECRIIERNRHGSVLIIYLSEGISCERKRIRRRSLRTEPLERAAKQGQCDGSLHLSRIYSDKRHAIHYCVLVSVVGQNDRYKL